MQVVKLWLTLKWELQNSLQLWNVEENGSGSCLLQEFRVSYVKFSCPATGVLVN